MNPSIKSYSPARRRFVQLLGALAAILPWWPALARPRSRLARREAAYYHRHQD